MVLEQSTDEARERLVYAIRERRRFEQTMVVDDEQALRTWRKLNEDVELAETDYRALGSKGEPTCESQ